MVKVSVPNFFRCPISSELMEDPVTLCTGQTYDRRSIEKWFVSGRKSCPSTMQTLSSTEVVPNVILRRLIRDWSASNPNVAVGNVGPVVRKDIDSGEVKKMLTQLEGANRVDSCRILQELKLLIKKSETSRRAASDAGVFPTLCKFLFSPANLSQNLDACEQALGFLTLLPPQKLRSETTIGPKELTTLSWILCKGSLDAQVNAALLLESLTKNDDETKLSVGSTTGVFQGLVQLLKEDTHSRAISTALKASFSIVGLKRNAIKAVESGMVFCVMDLLPEAERGQVEGALTLLERLCSCTDGRTAVSKHALAVPLLARIINLRSSSVATEKAISCLHILCQNGPHAEESIDQLAIQAGVLTQLSHLSGSATDVTLKRQATKLFQDLQNRLRKCVKL